MELITFVANRLPLEGQRKHKLSNVEKVALFINRMITGKPHETIAIDWGISEAIVVSVFHDVLNKLNIVFNGVFRMPSMREMTEMRQILKSRGEDLWHILFVVDGIHICSPITEAWDSNY